MGNVFVYYFKIITIAIIVTRETLHDLIKNVYFLNEYSTNKLTLRLNYNICNVHGTHKLFERFKNVSTPLEQLTIFQLLLCM